MSTAPLNLTCTPLPIASGSAFGRLLQQFAQLILPEPLLAGGTKGGTGSQVVKFSPFAAVDTRLVLTSSGPSGTVLIPPTTAQVSVTVKTRHPVVPLLGGQTPISGISVAFAPSGSFSLPNPATTNVDGTASSSWTLVAGLNTATGTPSKPPLSFDPEQASFSVNAVAVTPFDWEATGWSWKLVGPWAGSYPSDGTITTAAADPAGYSGPVQAAFSKAGSLDNPQCTAYNGDASRIHSRIFGENKIIAFRRDFIMPGGATSGTMSFAVDNDFRVFVDGVEKTSSVVYVGPSGNSSGIVSGWQTHGNCPFRGDFTLSLTGLGEGSHTVVVVALDRGGSTYFDASVDEE